MGQNDEKDMPRGVRLNPKHDELTRSKIQTSQIINRLTNFINGKAEMSAAQVTAALGLLRKSLPDLTATELKGEVNHNYAMKIPDQAKTVEQWQQNHSQVTVQ